MTKPPIKHNDIDDSDFTDDDDMENENECPECGEYKNKNRKMCDSCMFTL